MKNNIKKLYLANLLTGFVFWYAIEKIFQQSIGLDGFGIAICSSVFLLTTILFDIPTGLLADRWNRKYTLILSSVALGIASFILGSANGLAVYAFGSFIYGLYVVLTSGTYQAIIYDSLVENNSQKEFSKINGRIYATFLIGTALGSIIGGYIGGKYGFRTTYFLTIASSVINIILMLTLVEPKIHKKLSDKKFIEHAKHALQVLKSKPILLQASILLSIAMITSNIQYEFNHLYLIAIGYGAFGLGFLNAGLAASGALGNVVAHKITNKVLLILPIIIAGLSLLFPFTENQILVPILLFALLIARGVLDNKMQTAVQDRVESNIRATSLSVIGFFTNIVSIPTILLFGYLSRIYDIGIAFLVFGVALSLLITYIYLRAWTSSRSIFDINAES